MHFGAKVASSRAESPAPCPYMALPSSQVASRNSAPKATAGRRTARMRARIFASSCFTLGTASTPSGSIPCSQSEAAMAYSGSQPW